MTLPIEYIGDKPIRAVKNPQCYMRTNGYIDSLPHRKEAIEERAKERGWNVHQCQNYAKYRIGGKPYCAQHASSIALLAAVNIGEI